jgi:hypothetical protein
MADGGGGEFSTFFPFQLISFFPLQDPIQVICQDLVGTQPFASIDCQFLWEIDLFLSRVCTMMHSVKPMMKGRSISFQFVPAVKGKDDSCHHRVLLVVKSHLCRMAMASGGCSKKVVASEPMWLEHYHPPPMRSGTRSTFTRGCSI